MTTNTQTLGWTVSANPVLVIGEPEAHYVRASIGNQAFHIGPDYFDTKQEAEFFAEMFLHAIEIGGRAALAQQPATPEPVWCVATGERVNGEETYTHHDAYVPLADCFPLYTHPSQSVPDDVVRDAERYRWLRDNWFTMGASYPEDTVKFHLGNARWSEQPESNLDEAIDAAMLAAK